MCVLVSAATAAAGQHLWSPANAERTGVLRPSVLRARSVTGPAAGLYCSDLTQNGAGVHDLGWVPAGFRVDVDVPRVSFVTPQGGTYVLLVSDQSGQAVGCYRYQAIQ